MSGATQYTRPPGVRDLDPKALARHRWIEGRLFEVFERYGFALVGAPTFEYRDLYDPLGIGDELFHDLLVARLGVGARFPVDLPGGALPGAPTTQQTHDVVLRPDFTLSLARMLIERLLNRDELRLPQRLAYAGQVFRDIDADVPLRFREFRQVGVELVGAPGQTADLEVLCMAADCAAAVGLERWQLALGHGVLFSEALGLEGPSRDSVANGLVRAARLRLRMRMGAAAVSDYLDRVLPAVRRQLSERGAAIPPELTDPGRLSAQQWQARLPELFEDWLAGVWTGHHGLDASTADRALALARLDPDPDVFFGQIEPYCASPAAGRLAGELAKLCDRVRALTGAPVAVTAGASRNLGYYTGIAFEVHSRATGAAITELCGGGRYGRLHRRVYDRARATAALRGADTPALQLPLTGVGLAFGVERLAAALPNCPGVPPAVDLRVCGAPADAAFDLAMRLRARGLKIVCDPGADAEIGDVLVTKAGLFRDGEPITEAALTRDQP